MERTTISTDAGIDTPGIVAGRLAACDYAARFGDSHPPLNATHTRPSVAAGSRGRDGDGGRIRAC